MAWRLVIQPNGLFARWSDIVDNFTDADMTEEEAFELCRDEAGKSCAASKIQFAKEERGWGNVQREPGARWRECLETIKNIHGQHEYEKTKIMDWT